MADIQWGWGGCNETNLMRAIECVQLQKQDDLSFVIWAASRFFNVEETINEYTRRQQGMAPILSVLPSYFEIPFLDSKGMLIYKEQYLQLIQEFASTDNVGAINIYRKLIKVIDGKILPEHLEGYLDD